VPHPRKRSNVRHHPWRNNVCRRIGVRKQSDVRSPPLLIPPISVRPVMFGLAEAGLPICHV
jgi:hypothetical protein